VISDAFHLVTDLIGFVVSFMFIWFSRKKPTEIMTFGYHRMELMGALGNLFIIWALAIFLFYEATLRIINKEFVKEPIAMLIVATVGLPINIVMYFILHSGSDHSHGLMGEPCGEEFNTEDNTNNSPCLEVMC
jgi:cation diffusion facilitator family transporter